MNRLLGIMTPEQRKRLALEPVKFRQGDKLIECDEDVQWIYLTDSGLLSARRTMADGSSIEQFTMGGPLTLLLGGHTLGRQSRSVYDILVRIGGTGWRTRREALIALKNEDPRFKELMHDCLSLMDETMAEVAGCWKYHTLPQRLCRMFLLIQASLESNVIPLGLPTIVEMMDAKIHREARQLRNAGIIMIARNEIVIADLAALETRACTCFHSLMRMRAEFFKRYGHKSVKL